MAPSADAGGLLAGVGQILVGFAAVASFVGSWSARRHAKRASEIARGTNIEVKDQTMRVDAIAEHLAESQRQGHEIGRELIDTMRELRRRNNG